MCTQLNSVSFQPSQRSFMPRDTLVIVLTYLADPKLACVSKNFRDATKKAFPLILQAMISHRLVIPIIPSSINDKASVKNKLIRISILVKEAAIRASISPRLDFGSILEKIREVRDRDLVVFFKKICVELKRFGYVISSEPSKNYQIQAGQIRIWLKNNQTVLKKIRNLDLSNCKMNVFPEEICMLSNLETLSLSCNRVVYVPEMIGSLLHLKALDLSCNQISELPIAIANINNLRHLDLSDNRFRYFPRAVCFLKALKSLDISDNQLTSLPAEIANLMNLGELSVADNHLEFLPIEIGYLSELEECLDVSRNFLRVLPASIRFLKKLKRLNVSSNLLRSVPSHLIELRNLRRLEASKNQFRIIPQEMTQMPPLDDLDISDNPIDHWSQYVGHLRFLYLPQTVGRYCNPEYEPF